MEDFDGRTLTIKAWSITFGLVAVSGAFATHVSVAFLMVASSAAIVRAMREAGFHWGGEMEGDQKDFMHFSVTGD